MSLEYCFKCEEATGRAGAGDDSIYSDDGEGPFCERCWFLWDTPDAADTRDAEISDLRDGQTILVGLLGRAGECVKEYQQLLESGTAEGKKEHTEFLAQDIDGVLEAIKESSSP